MRVAYCLIMLCLMFCSLAGCATTMTYMSECFDPKCQQEIDENWFYPAVKADMMLCEKLIKSEAGPIRKMFGCTSAIIDFPISFAFDTVFLPFKTVEHYSSENPTSSPVPYACMPMMIKKSIKANKKTDDLNADFIKDFEANSKYFYKSDPHHSVDYMVNLVRMRFFASRYYMGEILLSFGLTGKRKSFDCNSFYSKLTAEEKELVESKMEQHPFVCRDPNYTSASALASFMQALPDQINRNRVADNHWAWFSATGETEPLKRLLDNYLYNPDAPINCIEWSYSFNVRQNAEVKNYLLKYMSDKTDSEKQKLSTLLPK